MHIEVTLGSEKRQVGLRTFVLHRVWCARTGDDRTWVEVDIIEVLPDGSGLLAVTDHPEGEQVSDETLAALAAIGAHPFGERHIAINADEIEAMLSDDTTQPALSDLTQRSGPLWHHSGQCRPGCACPPF